MKKKILITLLCILPLTVTAQRDWSAIEIGVTELSDGIYRLFVNNSVAVVVSAGEDGLLVIDAAWEQSTDRLMEEIGKITDAPVSYLINTHIHGDHTGGNKVVGKGATIIAHPAVREFLSTEQRRGETIIPPFPESALPTLLVDDRKELQFNGEPVQIRHLPGGHTNSDLVIFFPTSNVLVLGDLLFADYFPFVDVSNGGNPIQFLENVSRIINDYPEDVTIVGGHGPVYSMKQLKKWHADLSETFSTLQKAKEQGMTAEQMKENRVLKQWEQMGSFFITEDRWIDTLYPFL